MKKLTFIGEFKSETMLDKINELVGWTINHQAEHDETFTMKHYNPTCKKDMPKNHKADFTESELVSSEEVVEEMREIDTGNFETLNHQPIIMIRTLDIRNVLNKFIITRRK